MGVAWRRRTPYGYHGSLGNGSLTTRCVGGGGGGGRGGLLLGFGGVVYTGHEVGETITNTGKGKEKCSQKGSGFKVKG